MHIVRSLTALHTIAMMGGRYYCRPISRTLIIFAPIILCCLLVSLCECGSYGNTGAPPAKAKQDDEDDIEVDTDTDAEGEDAASPQVYIPQGIVPQTLSTLFTIVQNRNLKIEPPDIANITAFFQQHGQTFFNQVFNQGKTTPVPVQIQPNVLQLATNSQPYYWQQTRPGQPGAAAIIADVPSSPPRRQTGSVQSIKIAKPKPETTTWEPYFRPRF